MNRNVSAQSSGTHPGDCDAADRNEEVPAQTRPSRAAPKPKELALLGESLVSPTAVAAFLAVARQTVYRLAGAPGGIPCVRVGRSIRFRPAEVRAYLESRTEQPAPVTRVDRLLARRRD